MAFDSLSEKLQNVFRNLRSKGRLTEADVKAALKEVKMAPPGGGCEFPGSQTVCEGGAGTRGRIRCDERSQSGPDGDQDRKRGNGQMMGSETTEIQLNPGQATTIIMMVGLQGAGKTTTTAKLAGKYKLKGKKPLLVACDVYRPAAIKQLQINGEKQGVEVFSMGDSHRPVDIAKAAVEHAAKTAIISLFWILPDVFILMKR